MLKTKMKHFVCMVFKNNRGMSFVSAFISISLIVITLPFIIYALSAIQHTQSAAEELSTQHFLYFLRDEVLQASEVSAINDKLELVIDDKTILVEKYNQVIRRRVDRQGNEILLRYVKNIKFSPRSFGILVEIEMLEGAQIEKILGFMQR